MDDNTLTGYFPPPLRLYSLPTCDGISLMEIYLLSLRVSIVRSHSTNYVIISVRVTERISFVTYS